MKIYFSLILIFAFVTCKHKEGYSKIICFQYTDSNYTDKGDTVEIAYFNTKQQFTSKDIRDNKVSKLNIYNDEGKIVNLIITYNDSIAVRTDRKFDKFGLNQELKNYQVGKIGDTSIFIVNNIYSKDSTFVTSETFDVSKNIIYGIEENTYDRKRNLLSSVSKDPISHQKIEKKFFKYDSRNNNIETLSFDSTNNMKEKDIYIYNEKNKLTKESHFNNQILDHSSTYVYIGDRRVKGIRYSGHLKEKYLKYFFE